MPKTIQINRAPVLTLWASVVAERLGYDRDEALSLGKRLAGLNAQTKGRSLGIFKPAEGKEKAPKDIGPDEQFRIDLCGRPVPAIRTDDGVRALSKDKTVDPEGVGRYLDKKFGDDLDDVRKAMNALAKSLKKTALADQAYSLYEQFRPDIPKGKRGWGAKGDLDLDFIRSLGKKG